MHGVIVLHPRHLGGRAGRTSSSKFFSSSKKGEGWRDGLAVMSTYCSCGLLKPDSQRSYGGSQLSVTPLQGDPRSSSDLCGHQGCRWWTYICADKTLTHIKINFEKNVSLSLRDTWQDCVAHKQLTAQPRDHTASHSRMYFPGWIPMPKLFPKYFCSTLWKKLQESQGEGRWHRVPSFQQAGSFPWERGREEEAEGLTSGWEQGLSIPISTGDSVYS